MPAINTGTTTGENITKSVRIDSDLSDKEYTIVDYDSSDENVVNALADGNTQGFILIEAKDGSSDESIGTIVLSGKTKLKLVGTVAAGDPLVASTAGKGIKNVTDTKFTVAVAQEAGVTGDIISVLVAPSTLSV